MQKSQSIYQIVSQYIKNADYLIVTAGAGMGVDSGLPDFRGEKGQHLMKQLPQKKQKFNQGFWTNYKAFKNRFSFFECANPSFLAMHPKLFWGFYGHRLELYRKTQPHEGFQIIKKITQLPNIKDYFILTSNVDGQFQKAGFDKNKIYEFHGSIHHMQCEDCRTIFPADDYVVKYDPISFEAQPPLPACKECKHVVRPNILMFDDNEFNSSRIDQQETKYLEFYKKIIPKNKVLVIEFGAGTAVMTTRWMGERIYDDEQLEDVMFVRVNPRDNGQIEDEYGKKIDRKGRQFIPIQQGSLQALIDIAKELFK